MTQFRWPVIPIMLAALLAGSCKRKAEGPISVQRAPRVQAPTTEEIQKENREAILANLDPIPRLGEGKNFKTPDGEFWTRFDNGLMFQDLRSGDAGTSPKRGQTVSVAYVGTFPGSNKEFDRRDADNPLTFKLGSKDLVKGFSLAVSTMQVHGKRRFFLPPDLAYGATGSLPSIGPNQPLIFQIDLLSVTGEVLEVNVSDLPHAEAAGPPAPTSAAASAAATAPAP